MNTIIINTFDVQTKRKAVKQFIKAVGNQTFTVEFTKKTTGERRVMNARMGVTKHLRGGASTTAHCDDLLTTFDMQAQGYRTITVDNVVALRANGLQYIFN